MKNIEMKWNLFDGDGGEDTGANSSEARAFMKSIGAEEPANSESTARTEYGKPEDAAPESNPVGEGSEQQETKSLEDEFNELIGKGGKYADLYGQRVQQAIQDRFKNQNDWEEVVGDYQIAVAPLLDKYGLELGDIEGLANAIQGDDDLYRTAAEEEGITTERYKEQLRLKLEAERGRQFMEEYQKEQERAAKFQQWNAEAMELVQAFPNFDIAQEIQDPNFQRLLDNGVSVRDAFVACHASDILLGAQQAASQQTKQQVSESMASRQRRPVENGMSHAPAAPRKADPSKLTDEDMDEIFKRAEAGEKFSF